MSLIEDLKREEGFRAHAYTDSEGFLTIGYGLLCDPRKPGSGLTEEEAEWLLRRRVESVQRRLSASTAAYDRVPAGVKDALAAMAYQLGVAGVLGFKKMLSALEAGDYATAAAEALDSTWATQTPARARRVAAQIAAGK